MFIWDNIMPYRRFRGLIIGMGMLLSYSIINVSCNTIGKTKNKCNKPQL